VALLARDAEELLPATLASVRCIADEILLVDTGSRDATRALAATAGAKVLSLLWNDDFSVPRNLAMAQATGDWILWLDAGETLASDAAQALQLFVREQADANRAYMLMVEVPPDGKLISSEQSGRIRLVPNFQGLEFQGRIRESLLPSLAARQRQVDLLPWKILRSSYEHDPLVKSRKARRDLRLAELEIAEHRATPRLYNLLGDAYSRLGDTAASIDYFRRALQHCERGSIDMLEAYYGLLATLDSDSRHVPEQVSVCLAALEVYPCDAQLLCAMGSYLQLQGRADLAVRAYQMAAEHGQVEPQTWHLSDIGEVAIVCWCLCLQLLEQDAQARQVLESALATDGSAVRLRRQLLELFIKHDLRKEALEQVALLPPETPHREALRTAVRGACLAAKQNWAAALGYLQAAYGGGCRDPLCLRWLTATFAALGEFWSIEAVLHEWREQEPKNPEVAKYFEIVARRRNLETPPAATPAPEIAMTEAAEMRGPGERNLRLDPSRAGEPPAPKSPPLAKPAHARNPFSRS
jgi:tetratricopeptide (TPR) repeat protein